MLLSSGHKRSPRENFLQALQGDYIIWKYQMLKISLHELMNLLNSYGTLNQVRWDKFQNDFWFDDRFAQSEIISNEPVGSNVKFDRLKSF